MDLLSSETNGHNTELLSLRSIDCEYIVSNETIGNLDRADTLSNHCLEFQAHDNDWLLSAYELFGADSSSVLSSL